MDPGFYPTVNAHLDFPCLPCILCIFEQHWSLDIEAKAGSIKLGSTLITAEGGDQVVIESTHPDAYILCFREGQLLYPSLPGEVRQGRVKVQTDDLFVWTLSEWQRDNFVEGLFPSKGPRMTIADVDLNPAYTFKMTPWESLSWKKELTFTVTARKASITFGSGLLVLLLIVLTGLGLILFFTSTPKQVPMCADPNYRGYYYANYRSLTVPSQFTILAVEAEKSCSDAILNWSQLQPQIVSCLQHYFPNIPTDQWTPNPFANRSFGWQHYFPKNRNMGNNCSMPGNQ